MKYLVKKKFCNLMNKLRRFSIGCDIGGSHISCALVDIDSGKIFENSIVNVKVDNSSEAHIILDAWAKAIDQCKSNIPLDGSFIGIGFAIPGPFDYENGIALYDNSNQKFENLNNVDVTTEITSRLGIDKNQLKFTNDATAFALGSYWFGSGKGFKKMIAITLGTGFGSSFISHGKSIEEGNTVPDGGYLWDKPFEDGIADDYFSTRWFVNSFNDISNEKVTGVKQIAEFANEGNKTAIELFNQFGTNLGTCLTNPIANFEAEIVVIGGNIGEALSLFNPSLQKYLKAKNINITFKTSVLKESAAMLGATAIFI